MFVDRLSEGEWEREFEWVTRTSFPNLRPVTGIHLTQSSKKVVTLIVGVQDEAPSAPPVHDVIPGTRVFDP